MNKRLSYSKPQIKYVAFRCGDNVNAQQGTGLKTDTAQFASAVEAGNIGEMDYSKIKALKN